MTNNTMNTTTFRTRVLESDAEVLAGICNALNALADPENNLGFKFTENDGTFVISVQATQSKNITPVFEVTFKTEESASDDILALNALFKKVIPFFECNGNEIIVSLLKEYSYSHDDVVFEHATGVERHKFMYPISDNIVHMDQVVQLFNIIKIRKFLVLNPAGNLVVSAFGDYLGLTLVIASLNKHPSNIALLFLTKFNFVSAQGLAEYSFSLCRFSEEIPPVFQVSVFVPQDEPAREQFETQMELMDSISVYSNNPMNS